MRERDKLTPAVWDKWDEKLQAWALCYGGSRSAPAPRRVYADAEHWSFYVDQKRDGQAATWETEAPPGITAEAIDTNALVILLSREHDEAVHAYYCWSGSLAIRAAQLREPVHETTLIRRVREAMVDLERMDGQRKRREPVTANRSAASGTVVLRSEFVPENPDA